jgi:putative FmdB family regulatory protein
MPTYDYKCLDCNYTFEEFQKMTDEPLEICPDCKGKLKRMIGTGSVPIFKGAGFYQTDYKNQKKSEPKSEKSSSTSNSTENKSSVKTDIATSK